MPNLDDFLGKEKKIDTSRWEVMEGTYGCQSCDENLDRAYFNADEMYMMWTCSQGHESKVQLG